MHLLFSETCLIKDEKLFDRFDLVFGEYFKSIERIELEDVMSVCHTVIGSNKCLIDILQKTKLTESNLKVVKNF